MVEIVIVLLFCRNSTVELVVDCMRAGFKKKSGGSRGGAAPSAGGVGGVGAPPHLQTYSLLAKQKLSKKGCAVLVVINSNITVQ